VGRLTEKKGIEYSIRAVAIAREKYPKLHYDIIGDGPLRSHLEEVIDELGVGDIVVMHGARDTNYVREIMRNAQLFMLSSVTAESGDVEGQGLVLQEAQLPVSRFSLRIIMGFRKVLCR
jgi:colanic acid/amylovoran biosynthesis glycosyltransferase